MWQAILGNVLQNGTTSPQQIQPDKNQQTQTIGIYILVGVVIVVIGVIGYSLLNRK